MPDQLSLAHQVIRKGNIISRNKSVIIPNKNISLSNFTLRRDEARNRIALTFDGDGNDHGTALILNVLMKYEIHSTFFLTGKWVETYPDLAQRIVFEGHEMGNHTYTHPDLTTLKDEEIMQEITLGERAIRRIVGEGKRILFRQPYGHGNEKVLSATKRAGVDYTIQWSLDTLDWKNPPVDFIVNSILDNVKGGDIVLMHLGGHHTAEALDIVVPVLLKCNIQMVTVSELLFAN
jgi:peptidoglycan/xylan/chitin deacetylase (PgdA/CDA1 family)